MPEKKPFDTGALYFLLFLTAAAFAAFMYTLFSYGGESYEAKGFPMYVSASLLVVCLVRLALMFLDMRTQDRTTVQRSDEERTAARAAALNTMKGFFWIAFIPAAFILLGMDISFPLFEIAFLKSRKEKWSTSILFAVVVYLVIHYGFGVFLQLRIYEGILFGGVF